MEEVKRPGGTAKKAAEVKPKVGEPGYMSPQDKRLHASLTIGYEGLGGMVAVLGLQLNDEGLQGTGAKIAHSAEAAADAWIELAQDNPRIKTMLLRLTESSKLGVLLGIHLAMFIPLLADRGVIPPQALAMAQMHEQMQAMAKMQAAAANAEQNGGHASE